MLDHVILAVTDLTKSSAFYEAVLKTLGGGHFYDFAGKDGPPGHPDLKGFGRDQRGFVWLREGKPSTEGIHIGFVGRSEAEVNAFYDAALATGGRDNGKPGARVFYDPRYYAANLFDPDGYSLEVVYKNWQHPQT